MFKSIHVGHNIFKASAATATAGLSGFILAKYNPTDTTLAIRIAISFFVFLVNAGFIYLLTATLDSTKFFRKIVLGNDYLEGYWMQQIDSTSSELTNAPTYTCIIIKFEEAHYKISGVSFKANEEHHMAQFQSQISFYNDSTLDYPFTGFSKEHDKAFSGHTVLNFAKKNAPPTNFIGTVSSNVRTIPVMVSGSKIDDKENIDPFTKDGRARLITYLNK